MPPTDGVLDRGTQQVILRINNFPIRMAADYDAKLIVELYGTQNADSATRISDEMVQIGNAIFPRQIYEAYKRFRSTSVSHYFVSDLTNFKTSDVPEILKEIAYTTTRDADIAMMVNYLADIQCFDKNIVNKIKNLFTKEIISEDVYEYDLENYLRYLERSGEDMETFIPLLKTCFEDDKQNISVRKLALKKLLKFKAKEYLNFYYEQYDLIKGKRAEVIFTEEISTWHGGIIPTLHQFILSSGSETAKEILQKEQARKAKESMAKDIKAQEEVKGEYQTADVISDIAELRSKINKISVIDERFGFPIFSISEEIYQQGRPAKDKATLIGYCMILRSLCGAFDEKISKLEISKVRASQLLPHIKDLTGSINKFHFALKERGIDVDDGLYGLRNINRIVVDFAAHPEGELSAELLTVLKEEGLFDYYKSDDWSALHRELLLRYKGVLEKLIKAIGNQ